MVSADDIARRLDHGSRQGLSGCFWECDRNEHDRFQRPAFGVESGREKAGLRDMDSH